MTPAQGLSLSPEQWLLPLLENILLTDPMSLLKSFQGMRCGGGQGEEAGGGRKEVVLTGSKELQAHGSTGITRSVWEFSCSSHAVVLEKPLEFF